MISLAEEYPKEQERVRGLLEIYKAIPPESSWFAVASITATLKEADEAAISGDLPRMIRAYEAMKGCE